MKYKVVFSSLFIDDVKHVRGDVIDLPEDEAAKHGTRLEPMPESKKAAPKQKKAEVTGESS